ncbi:zinc finger protein 569-like isoform X6 [Pectinophora gossypiella]|uniref:C2H2-type domain-containing protein n=1 Tax=Pectinophora gossypiella TaxID=13191 RepID=A0A1E1WS31_PECGO|nr:zinc finger protein 569-like isoform X6 [Pectinophora gossypiella]
MNPEHHNINTGGGQPPGNSESQNQRVQAAQQQQQNNLTPTTSATDLRVNTAAVNVALSSVAKYWVFTNLFPGPVSVYGLPAGTRIENGKPVQDLGQTHASILNGDPNIILGHHAGQAQVAVSAAGTQQIPVSQIIAQTQSGQTHEVPLVGHSQQQELSVQQAGGATQVTVSSNQQTHQQVPNNRVEFVQHHNIDMGHHSQQHIMQQQLMAAARPEHTNQQIQLTVSEDGIVTVVEPGGGKLVDKDELHEAIKMPGTDHTLTVHQLQQIVGQQVLDSVVRIEQATGEPANILVTHNPDGTTSIEASAADPLIVKDEKSAGKIETAQFAIPAEIKDIKGIDLKSVGAMGMEGAVVKISAGASEHDLHAMYKVNVEDLSQLLAYHEVFGKLNAEGQPQTKQVITEVEVEAGTSAAMPEDSSPGHHSCDLCGKIFQFRYQLIVHRRYHGESKPFTCQVCGSAFANPVELSRHGKCHLATGDQAERHGKRMTQDKPYACTTCHKTFSRKEHLDNHVRSHTGETPYRCQFCAKTFTRKEHMVNHVRKHTGETPHRCDICKKSFTRKEHFMNHVMWHTGETPHRCDFCSKTFTRKEHLLNHVRQHTGESPHRCNFCSKSFTRREHLVNHVRQHTGETPFQCGYCPKAFTRKDHLVNHVRQHTGESPHKCTYCTKSFTRKEHLTNHVRQHTGESPHRCSFCAKSFTRKEHLTNHIRQHTGETPHKCTYCPRAFSRKEHLNNHVRQHTGDTPHTCGYCNKSFTRKEHLVNHVRQHTGETPFKCTYCAKSFSRKEHLTNHIHLHTGETPHKCPFCTKTFSRKEHLTNHVRIHTGESPHRCEFCQKTFTRKEHLTNHLKQHTGDTPHACKVCSKPFTRKEHLITHMRSHSCGERPYSCGECGKSFPLKGNLLFHERSHNKGGGGARPFRCDICSKDFMCKGHLVTHRRTHTDAVESGEPPADGEDCGDGVKCEKEPVERKPDIRTSTESRPQAEQQANVAQHQQNTPQTTVMQITSQQVRTAVPTSSGGVTGTFTHTTGAQHHAGAAIAHHPVTVNY